MKRLNRLMTPKIIGAIGGKDDLINVNKTHRQIIPLDNSLLLRPQTRCLIVLPAAFPLESNLSSCQNFSAATFLLFRSNLSLPSLHEPLYKHGLW